ncbi:MAG: hypothetical protein B7Y00_08305 [Sphingomonadales bacterium 17-56-6]|jgi:hypothetical protein|nr:MAG: hypothetical protein B7Y44_02315 [Sphingomonadales bacterium 28-55-16]OYZ85103.1 MAG: hypothetical protein B7Y00_08305 [Sphingomonadales bacterium 17-56-6]
MADQRFIVAIGRIEHALSRIEKLTAAPKNADDRDLLARHEKLKSETLAAIQDMDKILAGAN